MKFLEKGSETKHISVKRGVKLRTISGSFGFSGRETKQICNFNGFKINLKMWSETKQILNKGVWNYAEFKFFSKFTSKYALPTRNPKLLHNSSTLLTCLNAFYSSLNNEHKNYTHKRRKKAKEAREAEELTIKCSTWSFFNLLLYLFKIHWVI